jgi:hypothetical protein
MTNRVQRSLVIPNRGGSREQTVRARRCLARCPSRQWPRARAAIVQALIGKGYEIKSVTFARGEATENREIFLVTLQKDKSVAVCYFAAVNWINLSPATLEDSKRCDVR